MEKLLRALTMKYFRVLVMESSTLQRKHD